MFEVEKIIKLNQDWISIFLILSLLIIGFLKNIDKKKFGILVYSINSEKYFSSYAKEKQTNYLNPFNLLKMIFILNIISFLLTSIIDELISFQKFRTVYLIIMIIIISRYFILKYISRFLNLTNLFEQLVFKSFSSYFRISLLAFPLLLIYNYTFPTNFNFLFFLSFIIASGIFIGHLRIYYKIAYNKSSSFFYIILYLCAFKITPWLLVSDYIIN